MKDTPMPVSQNVRDQIVKIDDQIIDLLAMRVTVCLKAKEEDEEGLAASADQAETIGQWSEAAEEKGLDDAIMNQLSKLVMKLCQKTED